MPVGKVDYGVRVMHEQTAEKNWKRTFGMDLLRSVPMGVVETVGFMFARFVAVALLQYSDLSKSTIIGGPALELSLEFFVVTFVRLVGISANWAAALAWIVAGGGYGEVQPFTTRLNSFPPLPCSIRQPCKVEPVCTGVLDIRRGTR